MLIFLRVLFESFMQAMHELTSNKLRTLLSLLGVTIGIFCVIAVLTMVESLENNIRKSINNLGNDVLYVQKWPWQDGEFPWWKYWQRPMPTYEEMKMLRKELEGAEAIAFNAGSSENIKFLNNLLEDNEVAYVSDDFDRTWNFKIAKGRYFSKLELDNGYNVCILGASVYSSLFPVNTDPIGKEISVSGRKVTVIGVLEEEGKGLIDISFDKNVILPVVYGKQYVAMGPKEDAGQQMLIKVKDGISKDMVIGEIRSKMRNIRAVKPRDDDNFAINELSLLSNSLNSIFSMLNLVGWVIGFFSLIVGGFGIANIMFVSVKERTNLIGIKKALGARKSYILLEFLIEAIILCILGAALGLVLVYLLSLAITANMDFAVTLSTHNITIGILVSIFIGVLSGIIPASIASRLDPVEAIRSK